ncbi:STRADB isoform 4 [Pan troglodytes]|uniref:STRADB isoform 4 n=1 Tax=Pan troglodytes TaxID=9598 RepID=A0A2J8N569_PANTR|nr:STRADB isoform 4 [Pan troglodytes]
MSLLDCFCTSRTQVESLRPEKQSETSIRQYLEEDLTT